MRAFSYAFSTAHFGSHDKDCSHTIQSAISKNFMLHANFIMALCFIEPGLLPMKVLHCGNKDFRPFCFYDLDLPDDLRIRT